MQLVQCMLMRLLRACRMSRLLETWCLMEYAEKGSLADALRTGRLRRSNGFPELGVIIACLQDIASGRPTNMSPRSFLSRAGIGCHLSCRAPL